MTHEELPLATVFREVLLVLAGRTAEAIFGAHAVNAYCETERMTHDVDVLSTNADGFAELVRGHLAARFHIAVRVRQVAEERGYRIYQVRQPKNRHLVDIRQVDVLPDSRVIEGVQVVAPAALVALKVAGFTARRNRPKGDTDRADLRRLLLAFPDLKVVTGEVAAHLHEMGATAATLATWHELVASSIEPDDDDEY